MSRFQRLKPFKVNPLRAQKLNNKNNSKLVHNPSHKASAAAVVAAAAVFATAAVVTAAAVATAGVSFAVAAAVVTASPSEVVSTTVYPGISYEIYLFCLTRSIYTIIIMSTDFMI